METERQEGGQLRKRGQRRQGHEDATEIERESGHLDHPQHGTNRDRSSRKLKSDTLDSTPVNNSSNSKSSSEIEMEQHTFSNLDASEENLDDSCLGSELKLASRKILNLEKALKASKEESASLRHQVAELVANLHDAQDHIFGLQGRFKNITEMESAEEYGNLCDNIWNWVQSRLGDVLEDRKTLQERQLPVETADRFLDLISVPGKEAFAIKDTDEYTIMAAIMSFLCIKIFNKDFYCPLVGEGGGLEFLAGIEKSMRCLNPRPDLAICRAWRSQTMTALANRPNFESQQIHQINSLTESLTNLLRLFIPNTHGNKHSLRDSIQRNIIQPAINLAHKLQISVDKFTLECTVYNVLAAEDRKSLPPDFSSFDCVNLLAGGRLLKQGAPRKPGDQVAYIFDIFPGLVFRKVRADLYAEPKVLKKPKVLVAVSSKERAEALMERSAVEEVTILGWVYEKVRTQNTRKAS